MKFKAFIAITLALVMLFSLGPSVLAGPPSGDYLKYRGHLYRAYSAPADRVNWTTANTTSATLFYDDPKTGIHYHGHLVTINSRQEDRFVYRRFVKGVSWVPWIGLHRVSGNWTTWVTGEPLDYTNWDIDYPSGTWGDNSAALMSNLSGKWANAPDTTARPYIVEFEPA